MVATCRSSTGPTRYICARSPAPKCGQWKSGWEKRIRTKGKPMPNIPDDIFTEPEDASPDTLANLGPLRRLAGAWQSDKGVDINPKADGPQLLYGLRYHIHINTPEEKITFHDQVGYWLWEPATGLIMQTIAIPRGQVVLAGGTAKPEDQRISVEARRGDTRFGICSTTFLVVREVIENRVTLAHF